MSASSVVTIPAYLLPHRTPAELLRLARQGVAEAAATACDGLRYATAHLAALRAAAAVLAVRAQPAPRRRNQVTSVWVLLAAAQAGVRGVVTAREADDLVRAAEQFIGLVETTLGMSRLPGGAPTRAAA